MGNEIDSIAFKFIDYDTPTSGGRIFLSFDSTEIVFKTRLPYSSIHPLVYNLNASQPNDSYHSDYTMYVLAVKGNVLPKTVEMYEYYYGAPCGDMYYTMDLAEVAAYFQ